MVRNALMILALFAPAIASAQPQPVAKPKPEICNNQIDDDGNGKTDCYDVDACKTEPVCAEENCGDKKDNDADTLVDCNDDECYADKECRFARFLDAFDAAQASRNASTPPAPAPVQTQPPASAQPALRFVNNGGVLTLTNVAPEAVTLAAGLPIVPTRPEHCLVGEFDRNQRLACCAKLPGDGSLTCSITVNNNAKASRLQRQLTGQP